MKIKHEAPERHVLAITVDNEAGILAKIAGLFTARGYNIDSLTVADISDNHATSRITIVTQGAPATIDQIHAQLERLIPVHRVVDLTERGPHVEREMALIKVAGSDAQMAQARSHAATFGARAIDETAQSVIFELTDSSERIDSLVALVRDHGLVEVGRSGIVGLMCGADRT